MLAGVVLVAPTSVPACPLIAMLPNEWTSRQGRRRYKREPGVVG